MYGGAPNTLQKDLPLNFWVIKLKIAFAGNKKVHIGQFREAKK